MDIRFPGFYDRGLRSLGDNNQKIVQEKMLKNIVQACTSVFIRPRLCVKNVLRMMLNAEVFLHSL